MPSPKGVTSGESPGECLALIREDKTISCALVINMLVPSSARSGSYLGLFPKKARSIRASAELGFF